MQIAQKKRAYIVQLFLKNPLTYYVKYAIIELQKENNSGGNAHEQKGPDTMEEYGYTLDEIEQDEIKPYTAEQREIIDEMNAEIKALAAELFD